MRESLSPPGTPVARGGRPCEGVGGRSRLHAGPCLLANCFFRDLGWRVDSLAIQSCPEFHFLQGFAGSSCFRWAHITLPFWDCGQLPAVGWSRCPPRREVASIIPNHHPLYPHFSLLGLQWKLGGEKLWGSLWLPSPVCLGGEGGGRLRVLVPPGGPLWLLPSFLM